MKRARLFQEYSVVPGNSDLREDEEENPESEPFFKPFRYLPSSKKWNKHILVPQAHF